MRRRALHRSQHHEIDTEEGGARELGRVVA
jgi:hypothetical protein